jgi:uncharacterized membrane protein YoaK (UPF0700 family)
MVRSAIGDQSMKLTLPVLLSTTGGYTDTAGFLALQGLFTAHVTGNFVTLASALVLGTSGVIAKLMALPVFCVIVLLTRFLSFQLPVMGLPGLRGLLSLKAMLLLVGAVLAIRYGPFASGDSGPAILTGMTLVCAMAIQNAVHRIHLASAPPTTLMTGTTTQIMIDLADLIRGAPAAALDAIRMRLVRMVASVSAFAAGCAVAALAYAFFGMWCFCVPPILALWALIHRESAALQER